MVRLILELYQDVQETQKVGTHPDAHTYIKIPPLRICSFMQLPHGTKFCSKAFYDCRKNVRYML